MSAADDTALGERVAANYTSGTLLARIRAGLAARGVDPDHPAPADLKRVDEYHIGEITATRDLLDQIEITPATRVLDIGCGIGGTARHIASTTRAAVTGIDITPEYVETATALTAACGLADKVRFHLASALAMPVPDGAHDLAVMFHVGMNIPDKAAMMAEAARVLAPGGRLAIFDIMGRAGTDFAFPVSWSVAPETSFLGTAEDYSAAADAAGLAVEATRDRRAFALEFFAGMKARMAAAEGPPALGLHLVLGRHANAVFANMADHIAAGRFSPVEMIVRKPA